MICFKLFDSEIIIHKNVVETFSNYIQDNIKKPESGGIIFGQIENNIIHILKVSLPNKFDKKSRFSFHRSKDVAQIIVDFEFENSGRKTIYLGEWHTHPENIPQPSNDDYKVIYNQIKLGEMNVPFIFMIIVGVKETYIGMFKDKRWNNLYLTH